MFMTIILRVIRDYLGVGCDCDALHKLRSQIIRQFMQNRQYIAPDDMIHWDTPYMFAVPGVVLTIHSL
jgi:hypothetical protein